VSPRLSLFSMISRELAVWTRNVGRGTQGEQGLKGEKGRGRGGSSEMTTGKRAMRTEWVKAQGQTKMRWRGGHIYREAGA
jgi:hypothetical protein